MNLEMQRFKAEFFKALAHPLRIRILELLSEGDRSVNEIQSLVGSEGSAVSQQLTILRGKNIVVGTKDGNRVIYSLRDPMIVELLSVARQIFNNHLVDAITMLDKFSDTDNSGDEELQRES
ncbi:transcriptional regulator [Bacillus canaveralius]|uniref:Transcriptional regulator n=1 Tax=Bacillus canaveralius TaxID=1403243 RepID=A0A2N5GPE3_9BACI|nr:MULTISPECIES: metalloregulator ArsR/SmtB family transcription factor [Bacillus]PLR84391.1 transcriptional regulator [Bacillus canaveralius]PLR87025.1 transcriptional regulator [Bacillus sp. V33-4]PLS00607.1 transcriptional regulator [Bacillus canaveralius]RSK57894.1 ArsR family transcriptional regulator [Bacillus canaveralius]